jgi:hypothetical protein
LKTPPGRLLGPAIAFLRWLIIRPLWGKIKPSSKKVKDFLPTLSKFNSVKPVSEQLKNILEKYQSVKGSEIQRLKSISSEWAAMFPSFKKRNFFWLLVQVK